MNRYERAAETRRQSRNAERAAFLKRALPERQQRCIEGHTEMLRLAREIAALPMTSLTGDELYALAREADALRSKLCWLGDWTQELKELSGAADNVVPFPGRAT